MGLLPFSNSNLEIGFSGQFAQIGDSDSPFEDVNTTALAVDGTYVKNSISPIKGNIDIRGQWTRNGFDDFEIVLPDGDALPIDLDQDAYYAQLAYRPSLVKNNFISNLEFVIRYSNFDAPVVPKEEEEAEEAIRNSISPMNQLRIANNSGLIRTRDTGGTELKAAPIGDRDELSFGIDYWLSWRSVLKFNYEIEYPDGRGENITAFFATWAFGF